MARKQKSAEASVDESKVATTTMVATEPTNGGDNGGSAPPVEQSSVSPTQVGDAPVRVVARGGENLVLTPEAYQMWLKHLQFTDARHMQWAQVLLRDLGVLSSWVGHPLDVDELQRVAGNDGPEVQSSVLDGTGKKPMFQPISVLQVDIENRDQWPVHDSGPLTEADLEKVCYRFHDRHPLAGMPVRLGNFFLLDRKAMPFQGFLWFKLVDRQSGQFKWVPNKVPAGRMGDALGKMRAGLCERKESEILPLPRSYVERMNEVFAAKAKAGRAQAQERERATNTVDDGISSLLDNLVGGGGGQRHPDDRPDRRDKRDFGGGGYRHPRRDRR